MWLNLLLLKHLECWIGYDLPAADPLPPHLIPYLSLTTGLAKNFHSVLFWGQEIGGSNSHWPPLGTLEHLDMQITKSL